MFLIHALVTGLALLVIPVTSAVPSPELSRALSNCTSLVDDAARLRCYDLLADRMTLPANEDGGSASEEEAVPDKKRLPPEPEITERLSIASIIQKTEPARPWLGIRSYRRNYILPITYNDRVNPAFLNDTDTGFRSDDIEMKFQLSAQLPLWENILEKDVDLYFAYTQLSFFQAYNTEYSAPFRDTSYEPELGLNWRPELTFMGWQLDSARIALNHQSNGRSEPLSRSWNWLVGEVQASRRNLGLGLRLWKRLPEQDDEDDNPDIIHYLGYGELRAHYDLDRHRFGLMLRNPLKKAGVQLDWQYRLNDSVSLYMQYFNGYGESLIDYDHSVNRIGVGFLLNEWP